MYVYVQVRSAFGLIIGARLFGVLGGGRGGGGAVLANCPGRFGLLLCRLEHRVCLCADELACGCRVSKELYFGKAVSCSTFVVLVCGWGMRLHHWV